MAAKRTEEALWRVERRYLSGATIKTIARCAARSTYKVNDAAGGREGPLEGAVRKHLMEKGLLWQ